LIGKALRDIVNLLIYGGAFIGLCAACITALSLSINSREDEFFMYSLWIGVCTAALYCGHRVIGLSKMAHIRSSERFNVIRKYERHIWIYFFTWILLSAILFFTFGSIRLVIWMLPGGFIAFGYVLPLLLGKKRLRDLGWTKIIMIGWSWAWLTTFVPLYFLANEPLLMVSIMTIERMLFIIALTIPFEIRDIQVDRSVGLMTLPEKFGYKGTTILIWSLCIGIVFLSYVAGYHYFNQAYFVTMVIISICTLLVYRYSFKTLDDYFFGGLTDGLMILALLLQVGLSHFI
jgi:4-hydroxybenzoate polyprenyltransferase